MSRRRRGFTLAEVVVALALLAVFSVTIVQLFVRANQLTERAAAIDRAVSAAGDLADEWKAAARSDQQAIPVWVADLKDGESLRLALDDAFQPTGDKAVRIAILTPSMDDANDIEMLNIRIYESDQAEGPELYQMDAGRYRPEEAQP